MKKHLLEAGLFLFVVPLLGNAIRYQDARNSYFQIPTQITESLNEEKTNLSHSLTIVATHACCLRFTMSLTNTALQGILIDPSGDPLQLVREGYIMVSPRQQSTALSPGQRMSLHWFYPSRYLLERNMVQLRVDVYEDPLTSDHVGVILHFPVAVFHPQNYACEGSGTLSHGYGYGMAFRYPSGSGHQPWTIEYQNCLSSYENPQQNALPLSNVRFRSSDYDGKKESLDYANAYLRLNADEEDFTIGNPKFDATSRWRIFPLVLGASDEDSYASFRLRDTFAVSIDGREMKEASEKGDRDLLTNTLYLPPVKTGESKSFSFSLIVEETGEYQLDSFHYDFVVEKDKNFFGSVPNSDYGVEVS
jgi:hypothetical protein